MKSEERALKIIREAAKGGQKSLSLSAWLVGEIARLPDELFQLEELEELALAGQPLTEIPPAIHKLTKLKRLDLRHCPLTRVPDLPGLKLSWNSYLACSATLSPKNVQGIRIDVNSSGTIAASGAHVGASRLDELRDMDLRSLEIWRDIEDAAEMRPASASDVDTLLGTLSQLPTLESLSWHRVEFKTLPTSIRKLTRLRMLAVTGAGLTALPAWVGELMSLRYLWLESNELTDLPRSIGELIELQTLDLSDNPLTQIPSVVFDLENLKMLDISSILRGRGNIRIVPESIVRLRHLTDLLLHGQPVEDPPNEIVGQGLDAIRAYWNQRREAGIDHLCEAKLTILGEPGAGKTTLAKKLQDPAYELNVAESSTEGIDVLRWSFPAAVRVLRDDREELLQTDFKVNAWDFGGQEIYHATHQFFLSRRSLYVLVADDRKEDTDFNYWLRVVELLGGDSPLIIVQNEKQDRQRGLDLANLRARFPNLRKSFRVNLATGRGLDELVAAIHRELEHLPHIGTPLPKTWSSVRAALEGDTRNHIRLDEYLALCEQNGFTREADKLQLGGYLHDLGICLHFQEDPLLKKTVILKPSWGTDAVYRVLDDPGVLNARGRFDRRDLERIWSDRGHDAMRDELLQLMIRFQLCYELPRGGSYIAPQLLSSERPEYSWPGRRTPLLRYEYEFMPKGILTRCIVALHHLITDQRLVWRSGVLLERNGTRAEVVEDYARREISVRVTGTETTGLLAIIDDQLARIHDSFPGLQHERHLPCQCSVCAQAPVPYAFKLSELVDFAQSGDKIQCRPSRKLIDASELLREVLPSACVSATKSIDLALRAERLGLEVGAPVEKEVFVSYSWTKPSNDLVDNLQLTLGSHGIQILRDKHELGYKGSIREFMRRIGHGKCVVVIISKDYLRSKHCMFELMQVAKNGDLRGRVFPIVIEDAEIYDGIGLVRHVRYWEDKAHELDAEMKSLRGEHLTEIHEELDLYADIRSTLSRIVDVLRDMNTFTREYHEKTNFAALIEALNG